MDKRSLLIELARAFPQSQVRPENLQVYEEHLADLSPEVLAATVKRIIQQATLPYFPTVAEIRTVAAPLLEDERRRQELKRPYCDRCQNTNFEPVMDVSGQLKGVKPCTAGH